MLRPLVEECLNYDPAVRPTTAAVCDRIQISKDVYSKESQEGVIILKQQLELWRIEKMQQINQLKSENEQQVTELEQKFTELEQKIEQQGATINQMVMKVLKVLDTVLW